MRHLAALLLLALAPLAPAQDKKPLPPEQAKAALLKLLDRPKVPADEQAVRPPVVEGKHLVSRLTIATEKKADGTVERMPVLVVQPAGGEKARRPAMIVLHGTGGTKDGMKPLLAEFADRGCVAVAIDARYHGDRVPGVKGSTGMALPNCSTCSQ